MGRALPTREGDHQVRLALAQHPLVPDERRMTTFVRPVRWILDELQTTSARPVARDAIDSACITFDDGYEMKLRMEPVELRENEIRIVEFPTTTNEHFQSSSPLKRP